MGLTGRHNNPKYICTKKQSLKMYNSKLIKLKGEMEKSTIVVGDFHITFSATDKTTGQKNIRVIEHLDNTSQLTESVTHIK